MVIEYNAVFGPQRSFTITYDPEFDRYTKHPSGLYFGASLRALTKLAQEKGYILAGCDSRGVNAFFVRRDVARDVITAIPAEEAYRPLMRWHSIETPEEQFALVSHLDYETV